MAGVGRSKLAAWMEPFRQGFTNPTWQHVLVLIAGAILSPGRRTVAAALRVTGLDQDPCFTNYHRVLNRNRWSSPMTRKAAATVRRPGLRIAPAINTSTCCHVGVVKTWLNGCIQVAS